MNRFNKFLVAAFMSAAMLLPNMAQAMDIIQFDQMTAQDRQDFLDSLSRDAETVLKQAAAPMLRKSTSFSMKFILAT
ncbi:MAG: hypothetical protein WBS18_05540 [Candidatus Acidiferrales bacterium]